MRTAAELDALLDHVRAAPRGSGTIELVARRPGKGEREIVESAELDPVRGLVGDRWSISGKLAQQLTLMNARAIGAIAGEPTAWPPAGDQLYVDLDLSIEHLPAGTQLEVGSAIVEITDKPHTGCVKFAARFGADARRWVDSPLGLALRLRGANARIVVAGSVRRGDRIRRCEPARTVV